MSKAFTREDDDQPDLPNYARPASPLPPGVKNYVTPGGHRQLQAELTRLLEVEKPRIAGTGGADSRFQLQLLQQRIYYLQQSLQSAEVVPPPPPAEDRVRFGATVTVQEPDGNEVQYRIVGVDEVDLDRNWVSWFSPIAKALSNARAGDHVSFKFPSGQTKLKILAIEYE